MRYQGGPDPISRKIPDIHKVLAGSYTVYFIFFLGGVLLDLVFQPKIFFSPNLAFDLTFVGGLFLVFASLLIVWAQHTSRNLQKHAITKETFCRGPYCFTRSPTHWGLFMMMLGFGILIHAPFIILTTVLSLLITRAVFLRKEEAILVEKYGLPYLEYKKAVKF